MQRQSTCRLSPCSLSPARMLGRARMLGAAGERPAAHAKSSEMTDIFQEVDEEVRRDKAAEFWKKYQNLIFGAAVLIVLASAGFRYWQYEKERAEQAAGDQFQAAIASYEAGKLDEANGGLAKLAAERAGRLSHPRPDDGGRRRGQVQSRLRRSPPSTPSPATPRSTRSSATRRAFAPRSSGSTSRTRSRRARRR